MRIIFAALALSALVAPATAKSPANSDAAVAPAPETTLTPLTPSEPVVTDNKTSASSAGSGGAGSGVFAWLARNGAADWRWLVGAMLALLVFLRLIRRGGGDRPRDLLGPPASMRPGAHPAVTPLPRTPDIR